MSDANKTHRERCTREMTRDVIFLFQHRNNSRGQWRTESVWLDRDEAEDFGKTHAYRWGVGNWQVYGVPSEGLLAELLRTDAALALAAPAEPRKGT